jgi:hypothetical protein
VTSLEQELIDLASYLDYGDRLDAADRVLARIDGERRRSASPLWLKVAAAVLLAVALTLTIPSARRAVARLLGIGAIEVRTVETTLPLSSSPANTVPGSIQPATGSGSSATGGPDSPTPGGAGTTPANSVQAGSATPASTKPGSTKPGSTKPGSTKPGSTKPGSTRPGSTLPGDPIGAVRSKLSFAPRLPGPEVGPIERVEVDDSVPGGLLVITYRLFTLVEVASSTQNRPVMAKLVPPGVTSEYVSIQGDGGVWVRGVHEIAYLDADGNTRKDTVRRSDSALVWAPSGITLRIEGFSDLADAIRVAKTVR